MSGKRSGRLYCETIFTGSFKGKDCGAPSQAGRTVGKSRAAYLRQIRVDNKEMRAWKEDEELDLSLTEYRILKYFLENKNQVLLKEQILSHVWDNGGKFVEENTLMVNIRRLRTKVEKDASHPEYIKTVHGMGYLWEERK